MSQRKDILAPFTEKLHKSRDDPFRARPLGRTADFYDSEVDIDWSKCDIPQPCNTDSFAQNPLFIKDHDRRDYRHNRILQILSQVIQINKDEEFDLFIERAYSNANLALKSHPDKATTADDKELLDRWILRFVRGFKLISRRMGKGWAQEDEHMLYKLVREECEILSEQDRVFVDPYNKTRKVKRAWEKVPEDNYPTTQPNTGSSNCKA